MDASESSIESRDAAIQALLDLGNPKTKLEGLIVYVPANKPLTDEQKQADPFSIYAECGGVFPEDDGDEFVNLCLKAKPDFATEIRRIFAENPSPSFGIIDAVGAGAQWPQLRATLKVDSARDILFAMMAPTEASRNKHFFDKQSMVLFPAIAIRLANCSRVRSFPFGGTGATVRSDGPSYEQLWS